MNVFISGGCKNGKSYQAQRIARDQARGGDLYYVATMIPGDDEDLKRIARHLREREGWGFTTLEQPVNILELTERPDVNLGGSFLVDSVTAILQNEMFTPEGEMDGEAPERVARDMVRFAEMTGNTVFVSDYIYGDLGMYSESTEEYRRGLAAVDRALAAACDRVIEISYGTEEVWK
ncbi:MAG: bifunctional adenosylcobinamide kinase/adenosylcobinamide-phosphate guanylyltransferase [Lentihominibacter sp.]